MSFVSLAPVWKIAKAENVFNIIALISLKIYNIIKKTICILNGGQ